MGPVIYAKTFPLGDKGPPLPGELEATLLSKMT